MSALTTTWLPFPGCHFARTSNIGKAIEVLEKVRRLDPGYVVDLHSLGLAYAENGEYDKAADLLKRVVELAPDHLGARYQLGVLHHNQARYEDAAASLEAALGIDSTSAAVHFGLGKAYHELGPEAAPSGADGVERCSVLNAQAPPRSAA